MLFGVHCQLVWWGSRGLGLGDFEGRFGRLGYALRSAMGAGPAAGDRDVLGADWCPSNLINQNPTTPAQAPEWVIACAGGVPSALYLIKLAARVRPRPLNAL